MSDTPETDAQITTFTSISKYGKHFENKTGTVSAKFARKLERERDQWRKCAERLAKYTENYYEEWGWSHLDNGEEALAEFERLKEKTK